MTSKTTEGNMTSKTTTEWIETIISTSIKEIAKRCIIYEKRDTHYPSLQKAILWGTNWCYDEEYQLGTLYDGLLQFASSGGGK